MRFRLRFFLAVCLLIGFVGGIVVRNAWNLDLPGPVRSMIHRIESSQLPVTLENFEKISSLRYENGAHSATLGNVSFTSWELANGYDLEIRVHDLESGGITDMGILKKSAEGPHASPSMVWGWSKWPDTDSYYTVFEDEGFRVLPPDTSIAN